MVREEEETEETFSLARRAGRIFRVRSEAAARLQRVRRGAVL